MDSMNSESESKTEQGKQHFHVLAVDDSQIDRKLLEKLLTVSSYQVTCVDSGDKALEYLGLLDIEDNEYERSSLSTSSTISAQPKVGKINLIMTDYSMPGISGYDLLKRVKDSSWKDIPVVIMSSENVPSRIDMCLEGGAEEFLLKPVKLSDLRKLHSQLHNSITNYPNREEEEEEEGEETETEEEKSSINGKNNINSNKRKATSSDISDIQPRVKELPVS